ncbi:outer membrane lipoprotein carrier protein LolA [Neisseriaceae bacterium PsAf]|nr:outer membrane lipoprotein carrier protein LolA [Neisseriaceae bacterium PsAf]
MKKFFVLMNLVMLSLFSFSYADDLTDILDIISVKNNVQADFIQEKKLSQLNKPMISSGRFVYNPQKGILWEMQKPVVADIVITDKKLIQKTNRSQSEINLKNSPYASIASLTSQLMSGNKKALTDSFIVQEVTNNPNAWKIILTPKDSNLKNLFNKIQVSGQNYINRIDIEDKNQSNTLIKFSHHQSQPLTSRENELFQMAQ